MTIEKFEDLFKIVEESVFEKIVRNVYGDNSSDIIEVINDLGDLDSVEVVMGLESHYNISIPDDIADHFFNSENMPKLLKSVSRQKVLDELGI